MTEVLTAHLYTHTHTHYVCTHALLPRPPPCTNAGVISQDHAELGLLQLPFIDFSTLLEEMYDNNGRLVQHASIFGAQASRL